MGRRMIPGNAAATSQQQALGNALHPETKGQQYSPRAHRVSPKGGCKTTYGGGMDPLLQAKQCYPFCSMVLSILQHPLQGLSTHVYQSVWF